MWFGVLGVVFVGSVALMGCGGQVEEGASASCGKVQPCGGNLVGNWNVSQACADTTDATRELLNRIPCDGVEMKSTHFESKGSLSFNANASYTTALKTTASVNLAVPASCLKVVGSITATCEQIANVALMAASGMLKSLKCTTASSGCDCTAELLVPDVNQSGTYKTSGTTLTLQSTTASTSQYCVQGDALHMIALRMGGAGGAASVQGDLLAKRR